jgi:hypothetical protein
MQLSVITGPPKCKTLGTLQTISSHGFTLYIFLHLGYLSFKT